MWACLGKYAITPNSTLLPIFCMQANFTNTTILKNMLRALKFFSYNNIENFCIFESDVKKNISRCKQKI